MKVMEEAEEEMGLGDVALDRIGQSMAQEAEGRAVAGLFHYDLAHPVTVPDRSSTLVSLINKRIDGEDVLLYKPEMGGRARNHPYRAIRFKNDTGFVLQGGPVTIYADGAFAGEAIFGRIEDAAESFLPYGLETGLSIKVRQETGERPLRLLSIVDGQLQCEVQRASTLKYQLTSRGTAERRVYVRVPRRQGWSLKEPPEGTRTMGDAYFVPLQAAVGESAGTVTQVSPVRRTVRFDSAFGEQVMALYLEGEGASPDLKAQIAALMELKRAQKEIGDQLRDLVRSRERLSKEQQRLRRNIGALAKAKTHNQLKRELASKLGDLEKELGAVLGEIVALEERRNQLRKRFDDLVRGLSLAPSEG